ncbi:hypothetical protein LMG23992_04672 [Cupriavidus laharis]|uniref:Uncharacterized protein n=1 Tax=Cupriavidus laharis TaxID=151654 RepID=A0ABM8XPE3_9BURK|nr:hypothetical protein LMG23992_04672 [Cupriavidus laharis]
MSSKQGPRAAGRRTPANAARNRHYSAVTNMGASEIAA